MERRRFLKRVAAAVGLMGSGVSVDGAEVAKSSPTPVTGEFKYRVGYVWLPQMSSHPFPTLFSSDLDDTLIEDYRRCLPLVREAGFNFITVAGLIGEGGGMQFPADLDRGFSPRRDQQIREMIKMIRASGLKFLPVVGGYSWGYRNIIAAHPEVASRNYQFRGITNYWNRNNFLLLDQYDQLEQKENQANPDLMCASKEQSWYWQERVLRFMLDRYDVDGFHFEPADQGRCWCRDCRKIENITYQARVNERMTALVKQLAPGKTVGVNSAGLCLEAKRDLPALKQMVQRTDYFCDDTDESLKDDAITRNQDVQDIWLAERPAMAKAIAPVAMGPFIHHRDSGLARSTWFMPAPEALVTMIRRAYRQGCRAIEYYACGAFNNPSRELNNYIVGHSLRQPEQSAPALVETIVNLLYEPRKASVRAAFVDLFLNAEMSCIANDVILSMHFKSKKAPVPYLYGTPLFKQLRYLRELERVFLPEARKLAPEMRNRERADRLVKCIEGTANTVRAYVEKQLAG